MRNLAFVGFGIVLAIVESFIDLLLPSDYLTPDLVLPLILYMGLLGFNATRGAAIAFVIGYVLDTLQPGAPICLNMFVLVCLFLISRLLAARLLLAGAFFHVLLVFLMSVASSLIVIALRAIFERHVGSLVYLATVIPTSAVTTALISPIVFGVARRIDVKRGQRREERGLR